jgi:hypothetical protein
VRKFIKRRSGNWQEVEWREVDGARESIMSIIPMDNKRSIKEHISPTAALVMAWAEPLYEGEGPGREYYQHLDLTAGEPLLRHCEAICPWYREVILNRKWCIRHLVEEAVRIARRSPVIFMLGGGKSPLSFELLATSSSYIDHIVEVDISGMEEKEQWYSSFPARKEGKISFFEADITDGREVSRIREEYRDRPSLILMEGISYYLKKNEIEYILRNFSTKERKNTIIIEYLTSCMCVEPSRQVIPRSIFGYIGHISGIQIQSFATDELREILDQCGGMAEKIYSMAEMERMRTGAQAYFPRPGSGWIECLVGRL